MKINRVLQSTMLLLAVVNMASSTEFTTTKGGNWNDVAVWGGTSYPQAADDVAVINHSTVTIQSDVPVLPCTAYVNAGGTLKIHQYRSVRILQLNGGTVDINGWEWRGQGGTGQVHIAGTSYWQGGSIGTADDRYAIHGSGTLTVQGSSLFRLRAGPGTDFSGRVVLSNDVVNHNTIPDQELACDVHLSSGQLFYVPANLNFTNRTLSGIGVVKTSDNYGRSFRFGPESVLRPGAWDATDATTFTLQCYVGNETKIAFDAGSKLVMDIVDVDKSDRIESINAAANKISISSDALLEVNLFTPHDTLAINNMVLWNANATLNGMFAEGNITFNNAEGWRGLSVTKSADAKQILFSGEFVGARTVLVIR